MTRFAGLPFVVIDDGTLPADTVPRLLPFATSVAVISADAAGPVAEQFLEAGVPAIVHARGGALLSHAAAHSVHSARHRARPTSPSADETDASAPAEETGDVRGIGHAVELSASEAMTIVVTGPPDDPEDWMRCALRAVSGIMQGGPVFVPMLVLADGPLPEGPVVALVDGGESSGYEEVLAAGLAQRLERPVELMTSAGEDASGDGPVPDPHSPAERLAHDAGVAWVRRELDDPLDVVRSRRDRVGAVVTTVHDLTEGFALEPGGTVSRGAVEGGSPRTAIEVLRDAPHDVIVVFDGVRLLMGAEQGRFMAAGIGETLTAETLGGSRDVGPAVAAHAVLPTVDIVGVPIPSPMAATIADPAHVTIEEPIFAAPTGPATGQTALERDADERAPDILGCVSRSLASIRRDLAAAGGGRHRRRSAASAD